MFKLYLRKFFNKIKSQKRKEREMRFRQTQTVMTYLRKRNKIIIPNNLKINEWVDNYLNSCVLKGELVNILTPWCISKAFERRFREQGDKFILTKKERRIIQEEIPEVLSIFLGNGFRVNWWITFNRSYLDSRLISKELEKKYKDMILSLVNNQFLKNNALFLDWEDDVLSKRSGPDKRILDDFENYVSKAKFGIEMQRWISWSEEQTDLKQIQEDLNQDVKYQIACEANEGKILMSDKSPLGSSDFLLVPLELPERFDNFTIFAPEFKKRIVSILSLYPWRIC